MFVQNVINKYGIFDSNIYNFDETGFFIEILLHAEIIIISNYKNKFYTKQSSNYKWILII